MNELMGERNGSAWMSGLCGAFDALMFRAAEKGDIAFAIFAFRSALALLSPRSFWPLRSFRPLRSLRPLRPLRPLWSLRPLGSLRSLRSLRSLGSLGSLRPLRSLRSLRSLGSLMSLGSSWSSSPLRSGRPCRSGSSCGLNDPRFDPFHDFDSFFLYDALFAAYDGRAVDFPLFLADGNDFLDAFTRPGLARFIRRRRTDRLDYRRLFRRMNRRFRDEYRLFVRKEDSRASPSNPVYLLPGPLTDQA